MSRCRVKTVKKGKVDLDSFSVKRKIEIDIDIFEKWMDRFNLTENIIDPEIEDDTFFIKFSSKYSYPEFIIDMINNIKLVYDLKTEAESFKLLIYKPYKGLDDDKTFFIPKTDMSIVHRVILTVKGRENFDVSAGTGSINGTNNILCFNYDSFSIPMAISAALEISFNTSKSCKLPHKNGFRDGRKVTKKPDERYIIVIDFNVNNKVLATHMTEKISDISKGDDSIKNDLNDKFMDMFNINKNDKNNGKDEEIDDFLNEIKK